MKIANDEKHRRRVAIRNLIIAVLLIIIFFLIFGNHKGDNGLAAKETQARDSATAANYPANLPAEEDAEIIAKQMVRKHFDKPDDVEFLKDGAQTASYADSSYVFTGQLSAPGKTGDKTTQTYHIGLKWNGGSAADTNSWVLKYCRVRE